MTEVTNEVTNEVIAEIQKNSRERIRVSFTEYHERELVDIRTYWLDGQEWKPGKGLSVRREILPELHAAIAQALSRLPAELHPPPEKKRRRRRTRAEMQAADN